MTKTTFILAAIMMLISNLTAFSQDSQFGFIVGLGAADIHMTNNPGDDAYYDPLLSYNINGYMEFRITDSWRLSIEPGFIQKGAKHSGSDIRKSLNYIQMPFLVHYKLGERYCLSFGPEPAKKINAKNWSDHKEFELSGLVGVSYRLNDHFDIGLRYSHGITYAYETGWLASPGSMPASKEYNQYLQFILKYEI